MRQGADHEAVREPRPRFENVQRDGADGGPEGEGVHRIRGGLLGALEEAGVGGHEDLVFGEGFAVGEGLDGHG